MVGRSSPNVAASLYAGSIMVKSTVLCGLLSCVIDIAPAGLLLVLGTETGRVARRRRRGWFLASSRAIRPSEYRRLDSLVRRGGGELRRDGVRCPARVGGIRSLRSYEERATDRCRC